MKEIRYNSVIFIALLITFSSCTNETKRPNIIYIMSDDHAYQAISAYGHGLNKTPNIDRLADEGVIFTRATVTNSICAPSRAVLLTGKHSFKNGKVDNVQPFNWDQPSFPKLMQANGYETAMIGKIHLDGRPQGFDYSMVLPGQGAYYNPDFLVDGKKVKKEGYVTDIITNTVLDWLKNKRNKDKPFCLLYHQKAPHRAWLPAKRHYEAYTKMQFPQPDNLFDDYTGRGRAARESEMNILEHQNWAGDSKLYPEIKDRLGIAQASLWDKQSLISKLGRMNAEQRADWDNTYMPIMEQFEHDFPNMSKEELMQWRYQRYMQDYLGCIAAVDEGVGQVLDYLEDAGLDENTIVVYTSDQGFYLGEHGWFDKRFMYEESFRTPLLMRYPKEIKPNTKNDHLVQNLDFAPTFLDYAGTEVPEEMQGESFRELASGKTDYWRDVAYYTYYEYPSFHMVKRHYGIATKRYKLMHFYYDIDEWELYDLEKDPQEMTNVYDHNEYKEVRQMMHSKLKDTREHYGDSETSDTKFLNKYLEHIEKKNAKDTLSDNHILEMIIDEKKGK